MCKRGMRGHFMLVVYVSMLVMMIFMLLFKVVLPYCWCFCSGNFGTSLPQTFTLIVWRWGEDLLLLLSFVVSFRGRYCGSLSCLSYIYVGSLARLLRPLCPRHLRICPGTHIAQFCGKQNVFFFQDLWANQCCCTDRFSPISTVPSDENIVDWAEALWDLPHQAALRKAADITERRFCCSAKWALPKKWGDAFWPVARILCVPALPGAWARFSFFKTLLTNRVVGFADYQLAANRRRVACQRCCQNLCSPWPLEAFSDSLARAATGRPYRSDTLQAERLPSRFSSHSWIWRSARCERCIWTPMAQHWKRLLPGRLCSAL